jgi:hypothetical protein
MYQNNISELPFLGNERFENALNVYQDENKKYFYNLLQSIQFPDNLPDVLFDSYTIKYGDTWPLISYKAYNDTKLWWVITYANNIINPIESLKPNNEIKIPKLSIVKEIVTQILTREN